MSVKIKLYRQEIYNYISTLNIKFSPFADMVKKYIDNNTSYTIHNDKENPYYRNICGMYSFLDDQMYVKSLETQEQVKFNRDLWTKYPKTANLYTIDSDEYKNLCKLYPGKVGLIKSIIYPCKDIDYAISCDELTILNHDLSYLQSNEQESIYTAVNTVLNYFRERWFIKDFDFEDQYPIAFMSCVYSVLVSVLLEQRVRNLNTDKVHKLHVWDYLEANGLGNYDDILTDVQARFLYRNMRYLKNHRGSKNNLIILADNLLRDLKVSLVGKIIFQQNRDETNDCTLVPEFISENVVSYDPNTLNNINDNELETMDNILFRVHHEGLYPEYSVDNSYEREKLFGRTEINELQTQLLELKKYTINTEFMLLMTEFLYDSLLYQASLQNYQAVIQFKDTNTGILIKMKANDIILLIHYLMNITDKTKPTKIPKLAYVRIPYKNIKPDINKDLPQYQNFNKWDYLLKGILDTKKIVDDIPFSNEVYKSSEAFIKMLGEQFGVLIKYTEYTQLSAHLLFQWMIYWYYKNLVVTGFIPFELTHYDIYDQWIGSIENLNVLLDSYSNLSNNEYFYQDLAAELLRKLLPIEHSEILKEYCGAVYDDTPFYDKLKSLFVYLTSQDLTYLDTSRTQVTYLNMMPISVYTQSGIDKFYNYMTDIGIILYDEQMTIRDTYILDTDILDLRDTGHNELHINKMYNDIYVDIVDNDHDEIHKNNFTISLEMVDTKIKEIQISGTYLDIGLGVEYIKKVELAPAV